MTVKLYHNPHSRAAMMHWLLEEIGCDYELVPVQYDDGSMRADSFLALNPMGKIPVLVDGDTVVTETVAIAIYLADKFKSPNDLAPRHQRPSARRLSALDRLPVRRGGAGDDAGRRQF